MVKGTVSTIMGAVVALFLAAFAIIAGSTLAGTGLQQGQEAQKVATSGQCAFAPWLEECREKRAQTDCASFIEGRAEVGDQQFFVSTPYELANSLDVLDLNGGCGPRYKQDFDYMYIQVRSDAVSPGNTLRFNFADGTSYTLPATCGFRSQLGCSGGSGTIELGGSTRASLDWVWRGWVKKDLESIDASPPSDLYYQLDLNPNLVVMAYAKEGPNLDIEYLLGTGNTGKPEWDEHRPPDNLLAMTPPSPAQGLVSVQIRADVAADFVTFTPETSFPVVGQRLLGGSGYWRRHGSLGTTKIPSTTWQWDGMLHSGATGIRITRDLGNNEKEEFEPNIEKQIVFRPLAPLFTKPYVKPVFWDHNAQGWASGPLPGWTAAAPAERNDYKYMFVHVRADVLKDGLVFKFYRKGQRVAEIDGGDMDVVGFFDIPFFGRDYPTYKWQVSAWVPTDIDDITVEAPAPVKARDLENIEILAYAVPKPPAPVPGSRLIFATNAMFSGNVGGFDGAKARCRAAAASSTNPFVRTGTFTALLSTSSKSANQLTPNDGVPYYNTGGQLVANNYADLWDGTVQNTIRYDENGQDIFGGSGTLVWTGTTQTGQKADNCGDWTLTTGNGQVGTQNTNKDWASLAPFGCNNNARLYCFGTPGSG